MAAPTKNATAFWGSTFEEFAHGATIPLTNDYYPKIELQGSVGTATNRHTAVDLATLGIPVPFAGKKRAMRIVMPSSGGTTSRYQLSNFWKHPADGDKYWVSWWDYLGSDWNIAASQLKNDGLTFTTVGHTNRNYDSPANGPLCYNADFTTRVSPPSRQAGLNLVGTTAQNGDGALQKGILRPVVKQQWAYHEVYYQWSHGSTGLVQFYEDGGATPVHTITGQNMQSGTTLIQLRLGFYHGPNINHTRTLYVAGHMIGPTRASVQIGVASAPPPPPTTVDISTVDESFATFGGEFSNQQGNVRFG